MRILYLVHQFFPEFGSGTERVTLNLARMAQLWPRCFVAVVCPPEAADVPRLAA